VIQIGSMHFDNVICGIVKEQLETVIRWAGGSRSNCSNLTGVIEFSNGISDKQGFDRTSQEILHIGSGHI
jgi:hypothetical protein